MKKIICSFLFLFAMIMPVGAASTTDLLGVACTAAEEGYTACNLNGCYKCSSLLWVNQPLIVGQTTDNCASGTAGLIRWNGIKFQGCDGSSWRSFTVLDPALGEGTSGDAYAVLLLHFDDNTFVDSSQAAHAVTNSGVISSTSTKKFGTGSGYFNGSSYLQFADSDDWYFGTDDFTIDVWLNLPSCTVMTGIVHQGEASNAYSTSSLEMLADCGVRYFFRTSSDGVDFQTAGGAIPLNTWTHVALVRSGTTYTLYINGVSSATATNTTTMSNLSYPLRVGMRYYVNSSPLYTTGYFDELRITKGIARWTSNFTPPAAPY